MNHEYQLVAVLADGWQVFECPECHRLVVMRIQPYRMVTLVEGDITAVHVYAAPGITFSVTPGDDDKRAIQEIREWLIEGGKET